jgi:hypothetical protein
LRKNWKSFENKLESLRKNWKTLKNTGQFEGKLENLEKNWKIWKKSKNLVRNERKPQTKPENLGKNQKRFLARRKSPEKWGKKYPKIKMQKKKSKEKNPRK